MQVNIQLTKLSLESTSSQVVSESSQTGFLPRRGTQVSTIKSTNITRSTVVDTWRWLWLDVLMRIIPLGVIPFLYITIFHLPLSFLGLTLHNWPQQLVIGLVIGFVMTCFASAYRMFVASSFFTRPPLDAHLLPGFY